MDGISGKEGCPLLPNSQRGAPSRPCVPFGGYSIPRETLAPSCQVLSLNYSPLRLRGLEWEKRKRLYAYSESPAHKYQLYFNIINTIHCSHLIHRGTEAQRGCITYPQSHSW